MGKSLKVGDYVMAKDTNLPKVMHCGIIHKILTVFEEKVIVIRRLDSALLGINELFYYEDPKYVFRIVTLCA
jgi:hypothetical protein